MISCTSKKRKHFDTYLYHLELDKDYQIVMNEQEQNGIITHTNWNILSLSASQVITEHSITTPFEILEGEEYFVIAAIWNHGNDWDTHKNGTFKPLLITKDEKTATLLSQKIKEHHIQSKKAYNDSKKEFPINDKMFFLNLTDNEDYTYQIETPWNGYFNNLDEVYVSTLTLTTQIKKNFKKII